MKRLLHILSVLLWSGMLFAQPAETSQYRLQEFMHNIRSFNRLYPQEKVWLHCDNTAYFQGDTIWFAAYVTSAETLRPVELSKVLYVELLNEAGELVSTQRLQIENGRCHGQIPLNTELEKRFVTREERQKMFYPVNPRTKNYYIPLPSGYYEVRAYTRAMLNWGEEICFSRVFPVFDTPEREGDYSQLTMENREKKQRDLIESRIRPKTKRDDRLNVDFYPEGGNIVCGLPCHVAYKVTDKEGRNLTARCQLVADGRLVAKTETRHDGMGRFSFQPQEGVNYKLRVETDRHDRTFDLPETQPQGLVLAVDAIGKDSVRMTVAATDSLRQKPIGMSITCRGKLLHFKAYSQLPKQLTRMPTIAKSSLSPGVNQVTLFDADGRVYAERLFYVHDTTVVGKDLVKYQLDKEEYKPFEKINLTISTLPHREGWGGSLSVRDSGTEIGTTYADNLQTYLLLTSDLKGYIHRPDYYFEADDSVHRAALDLLMMTQGWRRYAWKQLAGVEKFRKTHFVEEGLALQGQVIHPKRKKRFLTDIHVGAIVSKEKEVLQKGRMMTDGEGHFTFVMEPFTGRHDLTLSLTDEENRLTGGRILLHRHFSPQPREYQFQERDILSVPQPPQTVAGIFSFAGANLLENVQVGRSRRQFEPFILHNIKEEREKALDTGDWLFPKISIEGYIEDKYLLFENEDAELERLKTRNEELHEEKILWFYKVSSSGIEKEKFISNRDFAGRGIEDFELGQVDYIQFFENPTAHTRLDWAIPLSPEKIRRKWKTIGCWIYRKPKPIAGMRATHIDGYSEVIDYFHPQYNREIIPGEVDYRRTLYWNPCVELDEEGKAKVMFYNNGTCKRPMVCIEGYAHKE
ncbi:MAG: hypothetical protein IKK62_01060 [Bacteroidaceae bacterium]|nr:hypothetical protein [Bacteroidaceae bacterium]